MNKEQNELLKDILLSAKGHTGGELIEHVRRAAAGDEEVEAEAIALLKEGLPATQIESKLVVQPSDPLGLVGTIFGTYRVDRYLDGGGMGAVYAATEQGTDLQVALKLTRTAFPTAEESLRFGIEVETLGRLKHPGIAGLIGANLKPDQPGQRPYIALEFVHGIDLLSYFRQDTPQLRTQIELFAQIADIIHYAHLCGVIHRDLKPQNILVTPDGRPKLLDFGISRAIPGMTDQRTAHTLTGHVIGTPGYMSPEQADGDHKNVGATSDIYSLGVVMYRLLSGHEPYATENLKLTDAAGNILRKDPTPLGRHKPELAGDIERIVGKALSKEPERRYATAAALAADLRRHLNNEPVEARPDSSLYLLRRFARRNKAIAIGTVIAFASLLIGLAVALYFFRIAVDERQAAIFERDERQKQLWSTWDVVESVSEMADAEDLNRYLREQDSRLDALTVLDRAVIRPRIKLAEDTAKTDYESAAAMYHGIGEYQITTKQNAAAANLFRRELDLRLKHHKSDHPDVAAPRASLAHAMLLAGRFAETVALTEQSIKVLETQAYPDWKVDCAGTLDLLGNAKLGLGLSVEAQAIFERSVAILKAEPKAGPESRPVAMVLHDLAAAHAAQGRHAQAVEILRECLRILGKSEHAKSPYVPLCRANLARSLIVLCQLPEAEALLRAAEPRLEERFLPDRAIDAVCRGFEELERARAAAELDGTSKIAHEFEAERWEKLRKAKIFVIEGK